MEAHPQELQEAAELWIPGLWKDGAVSMCFSCSPTPIIPGGNTPRPLPAAPASFPHPSLPTSAASAGIFPWHQLQLPGSMRSSRLGSQLLDFSQDLQDFPCVLECSAPFPSLVRLRRMKHLQNRWILDAPLSFCLLWTSWGVASPFSRSIPAAGRESELEGGIRLEQPLLLPQNFFSRACGSLSAADSRWRDPGTLRPGGRSRRGAG